jgi:hypothetical protein
MVETHRDRRVIRTGADVGRGEESFKLGTMHFSSASLCAASKTPNVGQSSTTSTFCCALKRRRVLMETPGYLRGHQPARS